MRRFRIFKQNTKGWSLDPDEILADSISVLGSAATEGKIEQPLRRISLRIFLFLMSGALLYLIGRGALLGVVQGEEFFKKSQENRFFARTIFPPRGIIKDAYGTALVENLPSFGLIFEKSKFLEKSEDISSLLRELGEALDQPREFFTALGFSQDRSSYISPSHILISGNLSRSEVVKITSRLDRMPGIQIVENYRRQYAFPYAFSHVLGFVGKVSAENLRAHPALDRRALIGKSGIEEFYDEILRGRGGKRIVEMDAGGMETQFKLMEEPKEGAELQLTVDGELQKTIYEILERYTGNKKGGSAVALDPRSGAIKALVSFPGFDTNSFGSLLTSQEFEKVLENPLKPLFNRTIAGEFPSGSTIKPFVAAAALEEGIIDPSKKIYDEGFIEIPNPYVPGEKSVFLDWKKHGWIDFYDAIAYSANVYFYMVGGGYKEQKGLGIQKIKEYAHRFGLGSRLGIDIHGEKEGLVPDPEIKAVIEPENPIWRIGDTYNASIGQGGWKVTPLQMAAITAALANGGKLYRPYLLQTVRGADGIKQETVPQLLRENIVGQESLAHVLKGMRQTVTSGTAQLLAGLSVPTAAKTGTAQAGSGLPHAWVITFAPYDNPEIVVVVMIEHAGEGSTVAVPITNEILQSYFSRRSHLSFDP